MLLSNVAVAYSRVISPTDLMKNNLSSTIQVINKYIK